MKRFDWSMIGLAVVLFLLAIPGIVAKYQFRPGAGQQLLALLLVGVLVVGLWWWVVTCTYNKVKLTRRKRKWEE